MHSLFHLASSLTEEVIAAAVRVQKHFGIGALESIVILKGADEEETEF